MSLHPNLPSQVRGQLNKERRLKICKNALLCLREPFGLETVTAPVMPSLTFVVSASLSTALQPLLQQEGQQQREGQQQQRQEGQQQLQPPHALGDARMQSGGYKI